MSKKKLLITLLFFSLLSGCARKAPGELGSSGWINIKESSRVKVYENLAKQRDLFINNNFKVDYTLTNNKKITLLKYKNTIKFVRYINNKKITIYQRNFQKKLALPQTVVCYNKTCHDISIDILLKDIVEFEDKADIFGIPYKDILIDLTTVISNPYRWTYLSDLSATSLYLSKSVKINNKVIFKRLGLDDRIYVSGIAKFENGTSPCFGYFDSIEDLKIGNTRGGWCAINGILTNDSNNKIKKSKIYYNIKPFYFPTKFTKSIRIDTISDKQIQLFYLIYPEYEKGFLENLLK